MLKRVALQVAGSNTPVKEGLVITPGQTAQDVLELANLRGYELCPSLDALPFGKQEAVYDKVADGGMLFAYRLATAGNGAGVLSPASNSFTRLLWKRGWKQKGREFTGYYRTVYGSFFGRVRLRMFGLGDFYILNPPKELRRHKHWGCFSKKDNGWYQVHFIDSIRSVDEAIKSVEFLISEAFEEYN